MAARKEHSGAYPRQANAAHNCSVYQGRTAGGGVVVISESARFFRPTPWRLIAWWLPSAAVQAQLAVNNPDSWACNVDKALDGTAAGVAPARGERRARVQSSGGRDRLQACQSVEEPKRYRKEYCAAEERRKDGPRRRRRAREQPSELKKRAEQGSGPGIEHSGDGGQRGDRVAPGRGPGGKLRAERRRGQAAPVQGLRGAVGSQPCDAEAQGGHGRSEGQGPGEDQEPAAGNYAVRAQRREQQRGGGGRGRAAA
mmetsp:Transcript_20678/g.65977  ORF Transcript_20678/g.65977 Transcript_20678/m.65977 type:complete len:255 (-) Transcript_20678:45-809(-)